MKVHNVQSIVTIYDLVDFMQLYIQELDTWITLERFSDYDKIKQQLEEPKMKREQAHQQIVEYVINLLPENADIDKVAHELDDLLNVALQGLPNE